MRWGSRTLQPIGADMDYQDLVDSVRDSLAQYQYTEPCDILSIEGVEGVVLATRRRLTVRYLCGVFCLPEGFDTVGQAKTLFGAIRNGFTKRYARFPYWKELGTYLVWICSSGLFDDAQGRMGHFKDKTGLHMNVMLGMVLVDREKFTTSTDCTWGLAYSGKHFRAIGAAVSEWCERQRGEQGAAANAAKMR